MAVGRNGARVVTAGRRGWGQSFCVPLLLIDVLDVDVAIERHSFVGLRCVRALRAQRVGPLDCDPGRRHCCAACCVGATNWTNELFELSLDVTRRLLSLFLD